MKYFLALLLSLFLTHAYATDKLRYNLYIDADFSNTLESSESIERGFQTAFREASDELSVELELVRMDHRGNSRRSLKNLKKFTQDDTALAVITGLHSPPVLSNLAFINAQQILTLDPWAAAGPITRRINEKGENWVFRLSVDDSKAGAFLVEEAIKQGFKRPYLLLEDTGWGKSNFNNINDALERNQLVNAGVSWFNWSLGLNSAKNVVRQAYSSGADVIFLVANTPEGVTLTQAMLSFDLSERLPVRSHWGITGGDYANIVSAEERAGLDLQFIQTRFSFLSTPLSPLGQQVLTQVIQSYPDVAQAEHIKAPTGFVHGYDLGKILLAALKQTDLTGDIKSDRLALKNSLENLSGQIPGLIKTYQRPFTLYSEATPDAHEALGHDDLALGYFGPNNEILLIR